MTFFLDNMFPPRFSKAFREVDKDVWHLRERFEQDAPDAVWLPELAATSSVLITLDRHIRTRPLEREALSRSGIVALFIGPFFSKNQFWDQFVWLVRHKKGIEDTARGLERGACMLVKQNGKMYPLGRQA
jgi:hypothetical protein